MATVNMMVGGVTSSRARFACKVDDGPVRVAVASNSGMEGATFFGPENIDANDVAMVEATGLDSNTRYWWQVEDDGVLDTSLTGQFLTHPPLNSHATFTIAAAGDAGLQPTFPGEGSVLASHRISNHVAFDTIRERALQEDWLMFVHLGDATYYDLGSDNHGIVGGGSLSNYRRMVDDMLLQPRQHALYRNVAFDWAHDDHDRGPNDHDSTYADGVNFNLMFRERVPTYDFPVTGTAPLYRSFQIGRILFIISDVRSARSPNIDPDDANKTMLGTAQKNWMREVLTTSNAEALCWIMADQWTHVAVDSWASFQTERAEMVEMFSDTGWINRMCQVGADAHALYMITQFFTRTNPPFLSSFFPQYHYASIDANPTGGPQTDTGPNNPGRNQYGTLTFEDFGSLIQITGIGYIGNNEWRRYSFHINVETPIFTELVSALRGSHRATFEARALDTFQIGDDPEGEDIPIVDGRVVLDGSADIRGVLNLTVDGNKLWPRRARDLLSPYGNEIFIRRGVDLGGDGIVWVPLGYFRIESVDQSDAPYGPIDIIGYDRMSTVVDSRLISPRVYDEGTTINELIDDLVKDLYPEAVIIIDDDSGFSRLGRILVVEEQRYDSLQDIANSLGKIVYWDRIGVLRIEDAPDNAEIVWDVNAGSQGVLVSSRRRITREGVYNAVVARGEAGDSENPVEGIAVDENPQSPTMFGGRFGMILRYYYSPLVETEGQAQRAARKILRRSVGLPYSVDFGSIVNPTLLPFDHVRITQSDGNREIHVLDNVVIPLNPETPMSGFTRDQTFTRR
jgi:hypothetical protein